MELQIHLAERFLHVHDMLRSHVNQALAMAPERTDHADLVGRSKAGFQ
jgi:hypothetical protein